MFDLSELCVCKTDVCVCGLVCVWVSVCMWLRWWSGVSHCGSGLSRPATQPLHVPREAPVFMGKSQLHFRRHSRAVWVTLRTATPDWHGAPQGQTPQGPLPAMLRGMPFSCHHLSETYLDLWRNCQRLKSDHALLTEGIISSLLGIVFK